MSIPNIFLSSFVSSTKVPFTGLIAISCKDYHGSDSNWDDFKQILRNTFQSVDLDYRNRVKLTNLKQGSDSIDTYNKNFLRFHSITSASRLI